MRRLGFGPRSEESMILDTPEAINDFIHEAYGPRIDAGTEFFTVTPLDARKRVIQTNVVAEGGKSAVSFTIADLVRHFERIWDKARWFVMSHNHPSGSAKPSQDDILMTATIYAYFTKRRPDTKLLDHIVTTATGRFTSIQEWEPRIWRGDYGWLERK